MKLKLLLEKNIKIKDLDFDKHSVNGTIRVPDELSVGVGNDLATKEKLDKWKASFIKRWGNNIELGVSMRPGWYKVVKADKKFTKYMSNDTRANREYYK